MVMIFANEKVRDYLLSQCIVFTYRKNHRKTPDGIRIQVGRDWATDRRGGKKIADINITPMEPIDSQTMREVLSKYVKDSGFFFGPGYSFMSVSNWAQAIKSLNPFSPTAGWIYMVEVVGVDS